MPLPLLPTINASLNGLAAILLFLGFLSIKKKNQRAHKKIMLSALFCSALFLVCYLLYHYLKHGIVTRYEKEGILRVVYFSILLTHTPLAVLIVPFSMTAVYHALKGNFDKHVKIVRWLFPVWMYVSITGVLIYLMLYVWI